MTIITANAVINTTAAIDRSGTLTGALAVVPLAVALNVVSPLDSPFTVVWASPFVSVTAAAGATLATAAFPVLKATDLPATGAPFWVTMALAVVDSPVCRSLESILKDTAREGGGGGGGGDPGATALNRPAPQGCGH